MHVDPTKPTLKEPGSKRSKQKYNSLISGFLLNLRRYGKVGWYRVVYEDGDKEDVFIAGLKGILK